MNYPILHKKAKTKIYKDGNPYEMYDLLSKTFNETKYSGKVILVTKEYIARPDLVSYVSYGTDSYADIICKINGISNPFELNEGMCLFIPSIEFLSEMIVGVSTPCDLVSPKSILNSNGNNDNIFKEFSTSMLTNERLKELINSEIVSKTDSEPVSSIGNSNSTKKKLKNERRSPAEQTVDEQNYYIDKSLGIIVYWFYFIWWTTLSMTT